MKLQRLPYEYDALKPFISLDMLKVHYDQYYHAYVNKLNILTSKTIYENADAATLIKVAQGPIFYNAAQVWNHKFYFGGLGPGCVPIHKGPLLNAINGCFGSFGFLKAAFVKYAVSLPGPGWIWLIVNSDGVIEIFPDNKSSHPLLVFRFINMLTFNLRKQILSTYEPQVQHLSLLYPLKFVLSIPLLIQPLFVLEKFLPFCQKEFQLS